MQNFDQTTFEHDELTDAELDAISGGNWFGDALRWIRDRFSGPGDLRRSTDRPN